MWGFEGFPTMDAGLARWVLAAEDICFKNRFLSYFFRLGKIQISPSNFLPCRIFHEFIFCGQSQPFSSFLPINYPSPSFVHQRAYLTAFPSSLRSSCPYAILTSSY